MTNDNSTDADTMSASVRDREDVIEDEVDAALEDISLVVHVVGMSLIFLCPATWKPSRTWFQMVPDFVYVFRLPRATIPRP